MRKANIYGTKKGSQYEINPEFVNQINFTSKEKHNKIKESIYNDIMSYPNSSFSEIHKRIGQEINRNTIRWILKQLVDNKKLEVTGTNRWARYSIAKNLL